MTHLMVQTENVSFIENNNFEVSINFGGISIANFFSALCKTGDGDGARSGLEPAHFWINMTELNFEINRMPIILITL